MADTSGKEGRKSDLPQIPDGGLSDSMPEWLRRPPAWRTLDHEEIAPVDPEDASKLPAADTSEIDPRTLLSEDDLPAWLRAFGKRDVRDAAMMESTSAQIDAEPERAEVKPASQSSPDPNDAANGATGSSLPLEDHQAQELTGNDSNVSGHRLSSEPIERRRHDRAQTTWWQGLPMILLLSALLLMAVVVIVVLTVV